VEHWKPSLVLMLSLLLRPHLTLINLEEILRLCWMFTGHIVKSSGRDVVCFAFLHKAVILKKVLLLGLIQLRLGLEDPFRFGAEE
jgi:hypothetical protein